MANKINIYKLYLDSLDEINADERGQLRVDKFNRFAIKAVRWMIDYFTGRIMEYDKQWADAKASLLKTQKLSDLLFPLIKREIVVLENGLFEYPESYDYMLDLRISGGILAKEACCDANGQIYVSTINKILSGGLGFRQVDILAHDEIANRINSHIPSLAKKPCAEQLDEGYMCYPYQDSGSGFMIFVRKPVDCKLVMKMDNTLNIEVYDDVNSVDIELHEKVAPLLSRRIAFYYTQGTRELSATAQIKEVGAAE